MTSQSAYRLRHHFDAQGFRLVWDAAGDRPRESRSAMLRSPRRSRNPVTFRVTFPCDLPSAHPAPRAAQPASVAFSVISQLSTLLIGQLALASAAISANFASSIPGTVAVSSRSDRLILKPPST